MRKKIIAQIDPRHLVGAISAMYIGETIAAAPTPKPSINLKIINT